MMLDTHTPQQISGIHARACRALWCAVVEAQWDLAFSKSTGSKGQLSLDIHHAQKWFGTRDFFMACAMAGVEGEVVLRAFDKRVALARGNTP